MGEGEEGIIFISMCTEKAIVNSFLLLYNKNYQNNFSNLRQFIKKMVKKDMEKKLRQLIKEAMIQKKETGNGSRYQTFKNILEKAQKEAKDKKLETLSDELIVQAAKREIKQLEDALQYFGADDKRKDDTLECIGYAKELLPVMVTAEQIIEFLTATNADKNMGACMKALKAEFQNNLDGKVASAIVKEYIK